MSEQPTPDVPETIAARRPEALTPDEIDAVLDDFRTWLHEAAVRGSLAEPLQPRLEVVDLHALLAHFTALRHEVNLQTKAVRAQQEQNAHTLAVLQQVLDDARAAAPAPASPDDDSVRAQLKTLVEIHDALALAAREAQRVREAVLPALERMVVTERRGDATHELPRPPFLARLFGGAAAAATVATLQRELAAERLRLQEANHGADRIRSMLDSLVTGYTMSVQRLERALRQNELEPIPCVGGPFDPERMEALEIVTGSGRTSGEVIEEVRRGYSWRGRVFRCAQVRVAKA